MLETYSCYIGSVLKLSKIMKNGYFRDLFCTQQKCNCNQSCFLKTVAICMIFHFDKENPVNASSLRQGTKNKHMSGPVRDQIVSLGVLHWVVARQPLLLNIIIQYSTHNQLHNVSDCSIRLLMVSWFSCPFTNLKREHT